jgi:hypothetical protein
VGNTDFSADYQLHLPSKEVLENKLKEITELSESLEMQPESGE